MAKHWWEGKTDAEIQKHYQRETDDFFASRGNYAPDGTLHHNTSMFERSDDQGQVASGAASVLDSLCDEGDETAETNADIAAVALEALRAIDAADKRCRYVETLTALTQTEANLDTGKHNMSDLARVLGVSRPTAIGRYRKLMEVLATIK
jgi:hypothetical protein